MVPWPGQPKSDSAGRGGEGSRPPGSPRVPELEMPLTAPSGPLFKETESHAQLGAFCSFPWLSPAKICQGPARAHTFWELCSDSVHLSCRTREHIFLSAAPITPWGPTPTFMPLGVTWSRWGSGIVRLDMGLLACDRPVGA